jgi:glucose dehydrogenase
MKKLSLAALLMLLLAPVLVLAQTAFDGTWKIDMKKAEFPKKPDEYLLQNGMYECKTCAPPVKIKADGQDQTVAGHPYYDTAAIKVISDHAIEETDKKNGKVVTTSKTTVSPDGNTLMLEFSDSSDTNAAPVTGKGEETRVAKGPAGSNAISGSWRISKFETISDNAITWTYKVNGNELTMNTPTGQSYTAKLDGTAAPYKGDPGTDGVSVKMMGKNTLEETDKLGDKVISVSKMTLEPDGKTAKIAVEDKLHGTTYQWVAVKQ